MLIQLILNVSSSVLNICDVRAALTQVGTVSSSIPSSSCLHAEVILRQDAPSARVCMDIQTREISLPFNTNQNFAIFESKSYDRPRVNQI